MKKYFIRSSYWFLRHAKNPGTDIRNHSSGSCYCRHPDRYCYDQVDGITSATSKPNQVSFNGTIVLLPNVKLRWPHYGRSSETHLTLTRATSTAGALLATLENPDFIALQQTYLDSHAQAEYLQAEYERQKFSRPNKPLRKKKFQQSKADYLSMKSKLEATAAQLTLLGIVPEELLKSGIQPLLQVKAPISGYISDVAMNIGKYIQPGEALCEVIDKSAPLLCLTTYEKDLADMKVGQSRPVSGQRYGQKVFKATLVSIGQKVDEVSRSLEVYARIDDVNQQFRPGMYVTARIQK